jgi:hypothetical protein
MTTSFHFPVVAIVKHLIFSCFVCHATAVNQIVVYVKFITKRLAAIVATEKQQIKQKQLHDNVLAQPKKVCAAKTELPIQTVGAITINN